MEAGDSGEDGVEVEEIGNLGEGVWIVEAGDGVVSGKMEAVERMEKASDAEDRGV